MDILQFCHGQTQKSGGTSEAAANVVPPGLQQGLSPSGVAGMQQHLKGALTLISSILDLFSLEQVALTFNGGKDACVVFYLVHAAILQQAAAAVARSSKGEQDSNNSRQKEGDILTAATKAFQRVKVLYFAPKHGEFPDIVSFMQEMARLYHFEYTVYDCSYQEGMKDLVENHGLKAVFMGVRSGDPYSCKCLNTLSFSSCPTFMTRPSKRGNTRCIL